MTGQVLGHYRVLEQIGTGGMGEVYRARDERLGRDVALKLVHPSSAKDHDRLRRFELEARSAASLNHPNTTKHGLLLDGFQRMTTPGITGSLQHRLSESVSEDCLHTLDVGTTALRERLGVSQNVCQKLAFPQAQEGFVLGEILGEVQEDFVQSHGAHLSLPTRPCSKPKGEAAGD